MGQLLILGYEVCVTLWGPEAWFFWGNGVFFMRHGIEYKLSISKSPLTASSSSLKSPQPSI